MDTVGERITYIRAKNDISQRKLAQNLGISAGNLSSYENNKFKPAADTIISICKYFNVSADWLLLGQEHNEDLCTQKSEVNLTKKEIDIVEDIRKLPEGDKKIILSLIERLNIK